MVFQEKTHVIVVPKDDNKESPVESEYNSATSDSDGEDSKVKYQGESGDHSASESEESVGLERQSGDGEESVLARKVDDDEDKKNPQYIPKRGTFYEHDDRTADDM